MAFIWTPEPAEPLFEGLESEQNLSLAVSVAGDLEAIPPSTPKITHWVLSGSETLASKAQVTQTDSDLTLYFDNLDGALPILTIDYLFPTSSEVFSVTNWGDLPSIPIQLVNYRKDANSPKILTLSISATDDTGMSETVEYQIIVQGDYTPGKNALIEVLNR
jgi:hypothetical protein